MNPAVKYTLGRLGLFVLIFVLMLPLPLNILVKAMLALLVSAVLSYFLLADWRNRMGEQLAGAASRRTYEKERLRAALAGDEDAAAAGDRVTLRQPTAAEKSQSDLPPPAAEQKAAAAGQKVPATEVTASTAEGAAPTFEAEAAAAEKKAPAAGGKAPAAEETGPVGDEDRDRAAGEKQQ
jgi:Protein of unknown function (DUF4229)